MFMREFQIRSDSCGEAVNEAIEAALIAAVILHAIDSEHNDARYTQVVANAVSGQFRVKLAA
jgi:hypothetical protein